MPELPEVETIRLALLKSVVSRKIKRVDVLTANLRSPLNEEEFNSNLIGKKILDIRRRAKYLFFDFAGLLTMQVHLGMTGSFRVENAGCSVQKHDRLVFHLDKNEKLVYNDIRKFGEVLLVRLAEKEEFPGKFSGYAPEPLGREFSAGYLYPRLQKIKSAVKTAIMQQQHVVGVGNIYASEALFAAKISPLRQADSLSEMEVERLVREIKKVLRRSLELGGTTISDYKKPDGSEGEFALELKVYGRTGQKCLRKGCKGSIRKIVQTGRSTFFCDSCQQ